MVEFDPNNPLSEKELDKLIKDTGFIEIDKKTL